MISSTSFSTLIFFHISRAEMSEDWLLCASEHSFKGTVCKESPQHCLAFVSNSEASIYLFYALQNIHTTPLASFYYRSTFRVIQFWKQGSLCKTPCILQNAVVHLTRTLKNNPIFYNQNLPGYDIVNFLYFHCFLDLKTERRVFSAEMFLHFFENFNWKTKAKAFTQYNFQNVHYFISLF